MASFRRFVVVALISAVLAGSLTGCQTVGSLVDELRITAALRDLTAQVEAIDGMTLSYADPELQGDYSYRTYLTMTASAAATGANITAATRLTVDALADPLFSENPTSFGLEAGDRGQVSLDRFGREPDEIIAELDYWFAVQNLVDAPVSMSVGFTEGEGGGLYAALSIDAVTDAALVLALAAIPVPSTGAHSWSLPGLEAAGNLPDAAGLALFSRLGEILPPVDYWSDENAHGFLLFTADGRPIQVSVMLVGAQPETIAASADWPLVLEALDATVASGLPASFSVQPDQSLGGVSVRWGQCEHPWELPEIDSAFFDLLAPHGLPDGAEPGGC